MTVDVLHYLESDIPLVPRLWSSSLLKYCEWLVMLISMHTSEKCKLHFDREIGASYIKCIIQTNCPQNLLP